MTIKAFNRVYRRTITCVVEIKKDLFNLSFFFSFFICFEMTTNNSSKSSPIIMGALILLLDLWVLYGAVMSSRSIAFKVGWTITVVMFPFGGLMLYLPVSYLLPS